MLVYILISIIIILLFIIVVLYVNIKGCLKIIEKFGTRLDKISIDNMELARQVLNLSLDLLEIIKKK